MAEGGSVEDRKGTMPERGKVKQVRQEWAVHEDGAFAYNLQNEEIHRHYGLNRFNRRTVRDDIPIAKVIQTDEEVIQQEERFQELQVLQAQAEEDERVAKKMMEQEQIQQQAHKMAIELTDEEFAKTVQEKEKEKYKRYLEKKKQYKLKKEREKIEKDLKQTTEEARIAVIPPGNTGSSEDLDQGVEEMTLQGRDASTRVTPGGRIEDGGDFTDFYNLPNNLDPSHRQVLQELQDEELAKLIQEQEHKRTNAEVDREKLKEIEVQDKRLAQIMQEQEKHKLKKAKQKQKQREEAKKAQQASQRPPALPPRNSEHDHRRFRRDSFIGALENGPNESETNAVSNEGYMTPAQVAAEQRLQSSGEQRSNRQLIGQSNSNSNVRTSRQQSHEQQQNLSNVSRQNVKSVQKKPKNFRPESLPTQDAPDVERWLAGQGSTRGRLRSDSSDHIPDSPESPPGSYHSDDAFPYNPAHTITHPNNVSYDTGSHYAVSEPLNFNIATAIDPTYTRQRPNGHEETERKQAVHQVPRPMAVEDTLDLEWDPNVRGSLRRGTLGRHEGSWDGQQDRTISSMSSRDESFHDDMGGVPPFAPVQGQRRSGEKFSKKSRKQSHPKSQSPGPKDKGNCKQQ